MGCCCGTGMEGQCGGWGGDASDKGSAYGDCEVAIEAMVWKNVVPGEITSGGK